MEALLPSFASSLFASCGSFAFDGVLRTSVADSFDMDVVFECKPQLFLSHARQDSAAASILASYLNVWQQVQQEERSAAEHIRALIDEATTGRLNGQQHFWRAADAFINGCHQRVVIDWNVLLHTAGSGKSHLALLWPEKSRLHEKIERHLSRRQLQSVWAAFLQDAEVFASEHSLQHAALHTYKLLKSRLVAHVEQRVELRTRLCHVGTVPTLPDVPSMHVWVITFALLTGNSPPVWDAARAAAPTPSHITEDSPYVSLRRPPHGRRLLPPTGPRHSPGNHREGSAQASSLSE